MRIEAGHRGKCPLCSHVVLFEKPAFGDASFGIGSRKEHLQLWASTCPNCLQVILYGADFNNKRGYANERMLVPTGMARDPVPPEVPAHIVKDFKEAALVLPLSPKASAALSRRCLQAVLRDAGGSKQRDLADQIEEISPTLPKFVAENLDHVRFVGNFAAHPIKSKSSGEIVDVEPEEAEWNLEILEQLFEHYFVSPARAREKRDRLTKKLGDAGKAPRKQQ